MGDQAKDAARWAWVREHGVLAIGEDDELLLIAHVLDDFSAIETPELTPNERRNLLGDGLGELPRGDALVRVVDMKRGGMRDGHD